MPQDGGAAHVLPPPTAALTRVVEAQHLAVDLGGIGFRILLQQERRDLAACDREEGLVGEQLDAARGVEDVGDVDLLALGLEVGVGAERAGRAGERQDAFVVDPDLAGLARVGDRLLAELVLAGDFVVLGARKLGVVVELHLGIGLADVAVVDPFLGIELLHAAEVLQHLDVGGGGIDQRRLDGRIGRHVAARAEEDVDDFLVDAGPFLDLLGGEFRIGAQPLVGGDHRLDIGDDDFGIFLGEVGAHHDAMPGRQVGLDAVENLAREAAERQQLGERHEVGMRVDLLFLQIGRADLGALADELEEIGGIAAVLHRLQHHAVGGGAEGNADELALEIGELVIGRILVDDDAVAGAGEAVGGDRDQPALAFRIVLEGEAVHDQRIVAHHAELQLVRHHRVGDGRAGGEVLPFELELDVGVFAVLRQIFLEQMQLADDRCRRSRCWWWCPACRCRS